MMTHSCLCFSAFRKEPFPVVIGIALFTVLLSAMGCSKKIDRRMTDIKQFDSIVASVLGANGLMDADRFRYQVVEDAGQRHYVTTLQLDSGQKEENNLRHWIAVVSVAKAGGLIDIARYEANQKHYPEAKEPPYAKRYVDVDLINIQTSYAPRGVFSGLSMTSLDDQFDVRIMASNLLPEGVTPPECDHDKIGKMILEAYAMQKQN